MKQEPICEHDTPENITEDTIMFRCSCGNVWISGVLHGSVEQNQSAVAVFGAFSKGPAKNRNKDGSPLKQIP